MVPMLTCGLVRSNFAFATGVLLWTGSLLIARHAGEGVQGLCRLLVHVRSSTNRTCLIRLGCLRARGLGDDLLRDALRNLGVGVELHAVARPALGLRPKVADVAEHLRERHQGLDDASAGTLLHRLD